MWIVLDHVEVLDRFVLVRLDRLLGPLEHRLDLDVVRIHSKDEEKTI